MNEDWEQVTPFLQEMQHCADDDYFNPQELLSGGGQTTTASAQSPVSVSAVAAAVVAGGSSATAAPSISPGGGSATGVQSGAISPGAQSQTSNAAGNGNTGGVPPIPSSSSCCENGRPIMTDPVSGQTVCSCQYDSARLALSGYSRLPTAGVSVYGTPYPSTDQNPYPSIGVDSSAFYSPLSNPYGLKESGPPGADMSAWTSAGLQPTTGYYPYDPALAAYGYGAGYDLAARRKNATRESTATLKAWLNEHKKNPYPTKGEKIMLAIITKMTLTQVSTWFANARRRLKKENKMTWEPKNKTDDDDDAMVSDDEKDKDDLDMVDKGRDHKDSMHHVKSEHCKDDDDDDLTDDERSKTDHMMNHPNLGHHHHLQHPPYHHHHHHHHHHPAMLSAYGGIKEEMTAGSKNQTSSDCGVPLPASKPKIWSLADTAACKTPPPIVQSQHGAWMTNPYHHHSHPTAHSSTTHNNAHQHQGGGNSSSIGSAMMMMMGGESVSTNHIGMNMSSGPNTNHPHNTQQQVHSATPQPNQQTMAGNVASAATMMNNFANNPYSRYTGFLGGSHHYNTNNTIPHNTTINNTNNSSNNNNNNTNIPVTGPQQIQHPNTPITPTHLQQQNSNSSSNLSSNNNNNNNNLVNIQNPNSHQQQHQSMGFPEVQTDTPPQTPPNMKLPSVAGNLITATQVNGTCFNNNNNNSSTNNLNNNQNNNGYRSASSPNPNGYIGNFTRIPQHSPQKLQEYSQQMLMASSPHQDSSAAAAAAFKPFYKSGQMGNGFVSPV